MRKSVSIIGVFSVLMLMFALSACTPAPNNTPPNISLEGAVITSGNITSIVNDTAINKTNATVTPSEENVSRVITGTEGDLIKLNVKAVDPDGYTITYSYTKPFNDNGQWQTKDGDAGKYLVTVTASDGKMSASTDVLVVVRPSNKAPVIDCPEDIYIKEGETVNLGCSFFDKENDPLVIEYSGWMNTASLTTNFESSGDHKVFVRASDGHTNVTRTILVHVENVDRAPLFNQHLKDMIVTEGDIVTLKPSVSDPDSGDSVKLTYSDPFDSKGVWKTVVGDAGTYPVTVVASDGTLTVKETFTLTVKMLNTAPVMKLIPNITVDEGDTVTIKPDVADREKDPISITYTGWMTSSTKTTTFEDAYPNGCDTRGCSATYKVTVTASDGVYKATQDVYVTVNDKNRPPVFVQP